MWWFTNQRVEQRLTEIDANTATSFQRAKADVQVLRQWISYLHQQHRQLAITAAESTEKIKTYPSADALVAMVQNTAQSAAQTAVQQAVLPAFAQLREATDRLHHVETGLSKAIGRLSVTEERLDALQPLPRQIHELRDTVSAFQHRREERVVSSQLPVPLPPVLAPVSALTRFREKVLRKLTTNSKDYIKGLLLTTIHKYGRINGQQLREIIVDEQGLCSRSSFYRLLEELETDTTLTVIPDGKNKIYLTRAAQRSH